MSKKNEPTEAELDRAYKVGQSTGLEEAASFLLEKATAFFKRRSDSEAELLRSLSLDLEKKAKERHPGGHTP